MTKYAPCNRCGQLIKIIQVWDETNTIRYHLFNDDEIGAEHYCSDNQKEEITE